MKRLVTVKTLILVFALLLGLIPVSATERPFASSGNGVASFITDGAGNVVGANLMLTGNGTHLGAFSGTGKIYFMPDANDPNIVIVPGEVTYVASNGDRLPTIIENGRMDLRTGIATGDMVFQSGTGRFEGASGSAAIVVEQNFVTGAYTFTLVGKVNY
ncbi:MAG TPA: hypothetical protein VLB46_16940 [Pyrinomonadaceae bacterium]|nr:hypothetical protein [Pyrinomonadaceae bacterium]